jgi:hypothetical protein
MTASSTFLPSLTSALLAGLARAKTVGDGGGGRLVDDTEDVEASNGTSILGGLPLVVVEVCGNSDDGLLDLLAELGLGNLLHLEENHGGDLLGGEGLLLAEVVDLNLGVAIVVDDLEGPRLNVLLDRGVIKPAADETLGIEDGVHGVHGGIVLGGLTDEALAVGEGDERGGGERTLLVGDDLDIVTLVRGDARVSGTCEVAWLESTVPRNERRLDEVGWSRQRRHSPLVERRCVRCAGRLTKIDADGTVVNFFSHDVGREELG